ncbi:hypothetical protein BJX64DRAFT_266036 [Aspergillus heterothallicus]
MRMLKRFRPQMASGLSGNSAAAPCSDDNRQTHKVKPHTGRMQGVSKIVIISILAAGPLLALHG